ncbi:hypothetical protein NECID01_2004 [Nematocida sp. AWRm77]|nr:hypothetical protein NECID01_2004 [Nematocida sp. AWRm77]
MNVHKEFRLDNYGIKHAKNKTIVEVCTEAEDTHSVLLLDEQTAVYTTASTVIRKTLSNGEEKALVKNAGTTPRLAHKDGVLAVYNKEGSVRLLDTHGRRLKELPCEGHPVRAAHFLGQSLLCFGGEQCRLTVYSFVEARTVCEKAFSEYIEHISSNSKYLALSLANGEVHIMAYTVEDATEGYSSILSTTAFSLEDKTVLEMGKPAVLQFVGEDALFIGLSSGTGYVYSLVENALLCESTLHSKQITNAEYKNGFIITSSLDGKLRISTTSLREVSSLHVGASLLSFSALFREEAESAPASSRGGLSSDLSLSLSPSSSPSPSQFQRGQALANGTQQGSQYLMSTSAGNVLVYQDRWNTPSPSAEERVSKPAPSTLFMHTLSSSTIPHESVSFFMRNPQRRKKYERMILRHEYGGALADAAEKKDREAMSSILQYLFGINQHAIALPLLSDENLATLCDMCIDYLRDKAFFEAAASTLYLCSDILLQKEVPEENPMYPILERGLQELEEECLVQSTSLSFSEYLSMVVKFGAC